MNKCRHLRAGSQFTSLRSSSPITGSAGYCPRAASGQAVAAGPSSDINFRRFIRRVSSARTRRDIGIPKPSALAVLRLTTNFSLVGRSTGRSGRLGQTYSSISSGSIAALAMLQARLPLLIAAIALAQVRIALLLGTYSGAVGRELRKSGKIPGLRNRSARNNRSICCGADQTSVGPSGNLRPAARTSDQV
jgi:hypothetical protein